MPRIFAPALLVTTSPMMGILFFFLIRKSGQERQDRSVMLTGVKQDKQEKCRCLLSIYLCWLVAVNSKTILFAGSYYWAQPNPRSWSSTVKEVSCKHLLFCTGSCLSITDIEGDKICNKSRIEKINARKRIIIATAAQQTNNPDSQEDGPGPGVLDGKNSVVISSRLLRTIQHGAPDHNGYIAKHLHQAFIRPPSR